MAVEQLTSNPEDGTNLGVNPSEKIALYGKTPIVQQSGANQAALTDSSGGTASKTIAAIGGTYNQAEVRNAIASLAAEVTWLRTALVNFGVVKGGA